MAISTEISWTDTTWNPLAGCKEVSPGCMHCYAATMAHRLGAMAQADLAAGKNPGKKRHYIGTTEKRGGKVVWNGKVNLIHEALHEPFRWKKPRRVFVNSMSDLFHADVPFDFIDQVFAVMAMTPQHTYQVLTKRPDRMADYLSDMDDLRHRIGSGAGCLLDGDWIWGEGKKFRASIEGLIDQSLGLRCREDGGEELVPELELPLPNVWVGTSCEDQARADQRIPWLLKCPAAVRFLSCEPLLGMIDLRRWIGGRCDCGRIEHGRCHMLCPSNVQSGQLGWAIVGGESGHSARPMHPDWVRSLRDQCVAVGVPFFFKQWGEWMPGHSEDYYTEARPLTCIKGNGKTSWWAGDEDTTWNCSVNYEPTDVSIERVGKKAAGHLIDGQEWRQFPEVTHV